MYNYLTQKEHFARNGSTATLEYLCPWEDRIFTGAALVGGLQYFAGIPSYIPPAIYGPIPGLVCTSVDSEPFRDAKNPTDAANTGAWWKNAKLTVNFGIPEKIEDVELGEISIDISAETFTLPKGNFKWSSGTSSGMSLGDNDVTPSLIFPKNALTFTVYNVATLDCPTITSLTGCTNNATFFGYEQDQLLFMGCTSNRKVTVDGNNAWTLQFKFTAMPGQANWQKVYCTKSSSWETVDPQPYPTNDLSTFFGGSS